MADDQPTHVIISRKEAIANGLKRYFTGKPCKRGHITWRGVANLNCNECVKTALNQFRANNLEMVRKREREHYHANPEWAKNKSKKAYRKRAEHHRKRSRMWYANNKERAKEASRNWRRKAGEVEAAKSRKRSAEYRKRFPEKVADWKRKCVLAKPDYYRRAKKVSKAIRRAREWAADGEFTSSDIHAILMAQRYRCAYCKNSIKDDYVMDHIVPLARGGSNDRRNMQATCSPCNLRKHARDPLDFARSLGMLL